MVVEGTRCWARAIALCKQQRSFQRTIVDKMLVFFETSFDRLAKVSCTATTVFPQTIGRLTSPTRIGAVRLTFRTQPRTIRVSE